MALLPSNFSFFTWFSPLWLGLSSEHVIHELLAFEVPHTQAGPNLLLPNNLSDLLCPPHVYARMPM